MLTFHLIEDDPTGGVEIHWNGETIAWINAPEEGLDDNVGQPGIYIEMTRVPPYAATAIVNPVTNVVDVRFRLQNAKPDAQMEPN